MVLAASAVVLIWRHRREARRHPSDTQKGALTTRFASGLAKNRITT
jgi:hypothetical protein